MVHILKRNQIFQILNIAETSWRTIRKIFVYENLEHQYAKWYKFIFILIQ